MRKRYAVSVAAFLMILPTIGVTGEVGSHLDTEDLPPHLRDRGLGLRVFA